MLLSALYAKWECCYGHCSMPLFLCLYFYASISIPILELFQNMIVKKTIGFIHHILQAHYVEAS